MFKAAWNTHLTLLYKEDEYTNLALEMMTTFPTEELTVICPPIAPDRLALQRSSFPGAGESVAPPSYSLYAAAAPLSPATSCSSQ